MKAREIVAMMASSEGFPAPKEVVVEFALGQIDRGEVEVFHYGPTVFTVHKDTGETHIYSLGNQHLLRAAKKFMDEVWGRVWVRFLEAPILNPGVAKLAIRHGWYMVGVEGTGHMIYRIERS